MRRFYIGRDGIGWKWNRQWFRLRPSWMPLLFSECYGDAVIWRGFGWRLAVRREGRPWHRNHPAESAFLARNGKGER